MKRHQLPSELLHNLKEDMSDEAKLARDISEIIASRIQQILKEKGMSRKDLAKATSHTQGVVSRWMSGKHNFTIATLAKISSALRENVLEF